MSMMTRGKREPQEYVERVPYAKRTKFERKHGGATGKELDSAVNPNKQKQNSRTIYTNWTVCSNHDLLNTTQTKNTHIEDYQHTL
jgi:hypothetical protein